ncbi:pilus assembly FimT family protein [Francisella adeliensis]|uniref:Prepilin-type N-terminal cleavage/methylation domain-containing protein n=1 Tax=Francisella adeliensis TaxID=2007306 RepID=A0A2Z4XYA0_9GAMM|nr:prepilin-type N-terminal cleavage/methylation domain-containing protein [Francisella adeliensis]AXA33646.1 type IV pili fiber building block protein [Francisella adeliensis]MBK2085109.1 prepilin-type N-terminal cleavage/methylation domain-containing protein [Francisella adeliensis]MBK2097414.1 prepilin-type N-terminal cleavage/methylation domain-containing protein [Francisella adeliensis]QIW11880.1 prepilin-type N-terminal cleavage/methylation domain-containing protein [Francisella adeliensi
MINSKRKGFSLVELMVVIAIMTILMMAAISSFTFYYKTFAQTRLTNLQKLIEYSVIRARTDGTTVIICAAASNSFDGNGKLATGSECNGDTCFNCSDSSSWGDSAIVAFESTDGSENYNNNEDTVIANLAEGHGEHIYLNFNTGNEIEIKPNGFMVNGNGNVVYCDRDNKYQAALITNIVGRTIYTDEATRNGTTFTCSS